MFQIQHDDEVTIEEKTQKVILILGTDIGVLQEVILEDGNGYMIFENKEEAGEVAKKYFEDMAENNPYQLVDYVGVEQLIEWARGRGETLTDWLEAWLDVPEEFYRSDEIIAQYKSIDSEKVQDVVLYTTCSS